MYKVPFRSLAIMYTNGIGKFQRRWTPAFAGVTLFEVIAFKKLDLIILNYLACSFYSRSVREHQRHWTPAFAEVTLFVVII